MTGLLYRDEACTPISYKAPVWSPDIYIFFLTQHHPNKYIVLVVNFIIDHHRSLLSGEYFVILLDSLTIRAWRDHDSDRNTLGTLLWLICSCHSVFLDTSSSGFIYVNFITSQWLCNCDTTIRCHAQQNSELRNCLFYP